MGVEAFRPIYNAPGEIPIDPFQSGCTKIPNLGISPDLCYKYDLNGSADITAFRILIERLTIGPPKSPIDLSNVSKGDAICLEEVVGSADTPVALWRFSKRQYEAPRLRTTRRFYTNNAAVGRVATRPTGAST